MIRGRTFDEGFPRPTSTDGGWACWRTRLFTVLRNPGGITVHVPRNLTNDEAVQTAEELAGALRAAASWGSSPLRAVPDPGADQ